ncbi:hypothetical protein D9757_005040 [Collybiopsis confluens]|uniref:F-box domain-containing protein n=1 Tax=Collybiopsis confluens TaxID=2823264 RepID=A0A8H5HTK0_9AGAR|nr:hypothetical protein D9757_005040 [Collybiopsis confluens]
MARHSTRLLDQAAAKKAATSTSSLPANKPPRAKGPGSSKPLIGGKRAYRSRSRDSEDSYHTESDTESSKKTRKRQRKSKIPEEFRKVRGKCGMLERLAKDVPLDVMFEIFSYLDSRDLYHLSRTTRDLRGILMSKSSEFAWRQARTNWGDIPPIPDDLNEPQYADLLFGVHCHVRFYKPGIYIGLLTACSRYVDARVVLSPRSGPFVPNAVDDVQRKREYNTLWAFIYLLIAKGYSFPHFQSVKKSQPDAYRNEPIFPREVISGVYSNSITPGDNSKSTPARPVSHPATAERFKEEFLALETDEERTAWIESKLEEREAQQRHAYACIRWYERTLENEDKQMREERTEAILKKLQDLGMREEAEKIGRNFFEHESVDQAKKLTDQAWSRIKTDLVAWISERRRDRLARENGRSIRNRYWFASRSYDDLAEKASYQGPYPSLGDVLNDKVIEDLIWETPLDIDLTKQFFDLQFSAFLHRFMEEWIPSKVQELLGVMQMEVPNSSADDLRLASSVFTCTSCINPLVFPEMFFHSCCFRHAHNELRMAIYTGGFSDSPWYCCLRFSKRESYFVKTIVQACGLDPKTATMDDMYASNPLIECLTCSSKNQTQPGYDPNSGVFMRLPAALWHRNNHHENSIAINSFGADTENICETEPSSRVYSCLIRCSHCNELFDSNKSADVMSHLRNSHQIVVDEGTEHTLKSLREHWYWNARAARDLNHSPDIFIWKGRKSHQS